MERPAFASVQEYGRRFTDPAYWRPFVETVCARHGLGPCSDLRAGLPGSHPVFLLGDRFVVKFFADRFGGATSFPVERELLPLLRAHDLPTPALLAYGALFPEDEGWPWPYLITTRLQGVSLGEVRDRVAPPNRVELARYVGALVHRLHALPLDGLTALRPSWSAYTQFLVVRRAACAADHERWGSLPKHLLAQLDDYLPPVEAMIDRGDRPRLLHADLNEDHLLISYEGGRWRPTGVIDFGDARAGDPAYELPALHLGLFHADKRLLRAFLEAYGWTAHDPDLVRRAMACTLLFEFDVLGGLFAEYPAARTLPSLDALARVLWDPAEAVGCADLSS